MGASNEEILKTFFDENWTLIVDGVPGARTQLAAALSTLGAKRHKMSLVGTFDEARAEIKAKKPKIVFCDYRIGAHFGLDLLQEQRREFPESKDCLFVLITGNTSQSAVAQAAEEDVDAFIIKPYTTNTFNKFIFQAVIAKLRPSEYILKIDAGKEALFSGSLDASIKLFDEACTLDPKPSLALFYRGQAEQLKNAIETARESYQVGLGFQKIHYKCLIGLFDLLQKQKRHDEAYDVVRRIVQYFPANPKRLTAILRLAITTKNYSDIEGFYQIFMNFDSRDDELIRYICSALSVTGKHYLRTKVNSRAFELFEKATVTAAGRISFIRFIIETLMENGFVREAARHLARFPVEKMNGSDFLACQYLISDTQVKPMESTSVGRALISKGVYDPLIFKILIKRCVEAGEEDHVDEALSKAAELWPQQAAEFRELVKASPGSVSSTV